MMLFPSRILCLAAPLSAILCCALVTATPRQTDAPVRARQASADTIEPDIDDDPNISIDNTDRLRKAVDASTLYTKLATQTYSQVSIGASPSDAVFTVFETVGTGFYPNPPSDDRQGKPAGSNDDNSWNIDHILELQVLGYAFSSPATRPTDGATSIPTDVWSSVSSAVNGANRASCTALASVITVEENLEGIPKQVNGFKQQVFTGRLLNQANVPSGNTYYTDFGKAVQKVLQNQQNYINGLIGEIGDELSSIGGGNNAVKTYWTNFAETAYQDCIDFLDTWTGLSYPRASNSSTPSSSPATPTGCYHEANPDGPCSTTVNESIICQDYNYNASSTNTQAKFNLTDARSHLDDYCDGYDGTTYPAITDNPSALRNFYDNGRGVWVELWSNINTEDPTNCKVGEVKFQKPDCITALQDAMSKCHAPSSNLTTGGNAEPFNCANFGFIGNSSPPQRKLV